MKRTKNNLKRATLTLLLAVLGSTGAWAADVVTIGTEGYGYDFLPAFSNYNYATSQQIFTKSEINHAAGNITAIGFHVKNGPSTRNYTIYMTKTSKDEFNSEIDWVKVSASDKVFEGDITFVQDSWNAIELDKEFVYDGNSNIIITVDDNTGRQDSWGGLSFYIKTDDSSETRSIFCYNNKNNFDPTGSSSAEESTYNRFKNVVQLTFDTYPTPSRIEAVNINDTSAQIQCSLRGGATAWNLRYREDYAIGIPENEWTTLTGLTTRSKVIEGLTAATKYEVQVQGVFADDKLSDWTASQTFYTSCCPTENQSVISYSYKGEAANESTIQIVDAETDIEMVKLMLNSSEERTGTLMLCNSRTYKVNFVSKPGYPDQNQFCTFSLSYPNGDNLYTMGYGEAPSEDGLLTSFVVDATEYDFKKPTELEAYDATYEGTTLKWKSIDAKQWLIAYSTDPDFDPNSEDIIPFLADTNPFTVTGLEADKTYYFTVCAVETEEVTGTRTRGGLDLRKVKVKDLEKLMKLLKLGRWSKKTIEKLAKEYDRPYPVLYKKYKKDRAKLVRKLKDKAKKFNLLTQEMNSKQTAITNEEIKTRVLEGNGEIWREGQKTIFSMPGTGKFDNLLLIPAKKGALVMVQIAVAKTGKKKDSYTIGWVSKSELNGKDPSDASAMPFETFRSLLKLTRRYRVKAYDTPSSSDELMEATDEDRQPEENAQARILAPRRVAEVGEDGYLWIRHNETNGGGLIFNNFVIVNPEDVGKWDIAFMDEGVSQYILSVTPATTYLAKLEPIYDDGTTGLMSPITVFTTLNESDYPTESEFTVGDGQKVNFARGNLRYNQMTEKWSFAEHAYEMIGNDNANTNASGSFYPADNLDLFGWSTTQNNYGTYYYYYYGDDEDALPYFLGDFVDWGTNPEFIAAFGEGWRTLSKEEWNYLLTERENAATLKAYATVAGVKGLIIAPDDWPNRILINPQLTPLDSRTYTIDQWSTMEAEGAVFLPAAGAFPKGQSLEKIGVEGFYWSSSASDADNIGSEYEAYAATFSETAAKTSIISRRTGSAVRLVKTAVDTNKQETAFNEYKEERKNDCDEMAMEGDDDTCKEMIEKAKEDIDNLTFDEDKTLDENKGAVDEIVDQLAIDLSIYRANGIKTVEQPVVEGPWYDMNGRRHTAKPTRKGVYIQNGTKYVVQ